MTRSKRGPSAARPRSKRSPRAARPRSKRGPYGLPTRPGGRPTDAATAQLIVLNDPRWPHGDRKPRCHREGALSNSQRQSPAPKPRPGYGRSRAGGRPRRVCQGCTLPDGSVRRCPVQEANRCPVHESRRPTFHVSPRRPVPAPSAPPSPPSPPSPPIRSACERNANPQLGRTLHAVAV
jgi:hypothetical protein